MNARALEVEQVGIDTLDDAPYNPRQMDADAFGKLKRGIERYGLVDPLVARREDRMIIGGHQRRRAARELGFETVPVVFLDGLDDQDAAALNVLLNNPSAQGEWDLPQLADVLSELDAHGFPAELTGFDAAELEGLLTWTPDPEDEGEVDVEPPEEPTSERGELWQLGPHRLMCGDATIEEDVARLLDGVKPNLCVTDPPYGVEYDPNWRNKAAEAGHLAYAPSRVGKVPNDDRADWSEAYQLFPGNVLYTWSPGGDPVIQTGQAVQAAGFEIRNKIIWSKPHFPISRGAYSYRHEPVWYAVREGATASFIGPKNECTIWEITLDENVEGGHSTQKPTECMERPIRNHEGDVYEPFCGSGTTIIACERQQRTCYAMEIDPGYCDVIRRRYANYVDAPELLP